jgi:hypothetical protein
MNSSNAITIPFRQTHSLQLVRSVKADPSALSEIGECHRFSVRDRILAHRWVTEASSSGYGRLVFASAEGPSQPEPCEYLLIYRRDVPWAQWGVACRHAGYEVWHTTRGTTLGVFGSLKEALDQVLAQPV